MRRGLESKERPLRGIRHLRIGYILGLSLIGTLAVVGGIVIQRTLASQLHAAEIINLAGRQRMLSQRLAKQSLQLIAAPTPEAHASLQQTLGDDLATWEAAHARLTTGDLAAFARQKGVSAAEVARLRDIHRALAAALGKLAALPWARRREGAALGTEVLAQEAAYLPLMNAMVFAYSRQAEAAVVRTRRTELVLLGLILVVLVAEALLIFAPLLRRLRRSVDSREAMAERLAASEARYKRAVQGADNGLWDWKLGSGALHWSARFCALSGLPADTAAAWSRFEERVVEADRPLLRRALEDGAAARQAVDVEIRIQRPEGPHWVRLKGRIIENDEVYLSGSLADIDGRRRLEAERERLLRSHEAALQDTREDLMRARLMNAVGSLAGGLAHDFNNYLQVIKLSLSDLEEEEVKPVGLDIALEAVDSASALARQLLALRRSQGSEVLEPVEVGRAVRTVEPMLVSLLPATIALRVEVDDDLPQVAADLGQLRQILVNLCLNARDAMPSGGRLKIAAQAATVRQAADGPRLGVEILVQDDGVGMSAEVHSRAFEPFFTTKAQSKGTGLGLAMVDNIVRRHGGWVSVESAEQSGTVVRIWLPAMEVPMDQEQPEEEAQPAVVRRHLAIMLVEDEDALRRILVRLLEGRGHTVVAAATGSEALRLMSAAEQGFDLLLSDVILTDIQGTEVAERMRELLGPQLPVLLMSGYSDVAIDLDDAHTRFLRKPFAPRELERQIWGLVGEPTKAMGAPKP